jgi:hypothetical protein
VSEAGLTTMLVHKPIRVGEFLDLVSWRLGRAPALPDPLPPLASDADPGRRDLD